MPYPAPERPWERIGVDIFTIANTDYLVSVDDLSGFFQIEDRPSVSRQVCVEYSRDGPNVRL